MSIKMKETSVKKLKIWLIVCLVSMLVITPVLGRICPINTKSRSGSSEFQPILSSSYQITPKLSSNFTQGSFPDATGSEITLDNNGDIYTVGTTSGELLLVKWSQTGKQIWNHNWISSEEDYVIGNGVVSDKNGSIYTVGTSSYPYKLILIKWDIDGKQIWNRTWNNAYNDYGNDIALDNNSNIYTVGTTHDGKYTMNMSLIKWDASGNQIWNRTWRYYKEKIENGYIVRYDGHGKGHGVTIDSNGNIYTVGIVAGKIDQFSRQLMDIVLLKWNSSGTLLWERYGRAGSPVEFEEGCDIVIDPNDDIYTIGNLLYKDPDDFWQLVLRKWDNEGNKIWWRSQKVGNYGNHYGWGVVEDDKGTIYTVGQRRWYTYYHHASPPIEESDLVLMKWAVNGDRIGAQIWDGGYRTAYGAGIALSSDENIYCVGGMGQSDWTGSAGNLIVVKFLPDHFSSIDIINPPPGDTSSSSPDNNILFSFSLEFAEIITLLIFLGFFIKHNRRKRKL
ncbi:MAG: hypothetical protein ACFFCZ_12535 [Promethearchaeota archaeon]